MRSSIALIILFSSSLHASDPLPAHKIVDESQLSAGMRIQINSDDKNLSREQCTALINAYRKKGLPNGQVSVHKPSTLKGLGGSVLPFCIENYDGEGIKFNNDFHPEAKG